MSQSSVIHGFRHHVRDSVAYLPEPASLLQQLNDEKPLPRVLLDSAEIGSRHQTKSLLLIDPCLKLVCEQQDVVISSYSKNGQQLLRWLTQQLCDYLVSNTGDENHSRFRFSCPPAQLDEDRKLKAPSVFEPLRLLQHQLVNHDSQGTPFDLFLAGLFGYDLYASFEDLPSVAIGTNQCPDYEFYVAETLAIFNHLSESAELITSFYVPEVGDNDPEIARLLARKHQLKEWIATCSQQQPKENTKQHHQADISRPAPLDCNDVIVSHSDAQFSAAINQLKEHICAGDIFQVVPSRSFQLPCTQPLAAYLQLKRSNPSPYMFFMQSAEYQLFGASPESALRFESSTREVEVYPIAGTQPRGKHADGSINHDLDGRIELALREDAKEKAEHVMLVDLARNDIARVSEPGTRHVKQLFSVDKYSHVMHLVSRVAGKLRHDLDGLHAYQACMNMGTLVGAPKVSAARLIRMVEKQRRGSYGGAVGYLNGRGDMDTCIVIRSAFVANGIAHVQAGAGVVADSVVQSECDETRTKAQAVINAIRTTETMLAATHQGNNRSNPRSQGNQNE